MRDLVKYPITYGEACDALQNAQLAYYGSRADDEVGSPDGLALLLAEQFIREYKEAFDMFLKLGPRKA